MACEYEDPHPERPAKPPIRKFATYNQKYEWPQGLLDAWREPTEEEQAAIDAAKEKKDTEDAKKK